MNKPATVSIPTYESSVLGALLQWAQEPSSPPLPPALARLLDNAPESFDDQRAGQAAAVIRELQASGEPVHEIAVKERLKFPSAFEYLLQASTSALTVGLAELEAEKIWNCFQTRQTAKLLAEAAEAVLKNPEHSESIRAHLVSELTRLDDKKSRQLESRIYDAANPPPTPRTIFSVDDVSISTAGNITTISAQSKAGKSAVIGAMISSTFALSDSDCLGIHSGNPNGLAVLHLDTEQSPYDHHQLIARAVSRSGAQFPPEWLQSYCLTGFTATDIRNAIGPLMKDSAKRFKGILALFVDGVADAVLDVNDSAEANAFVAELHALAIEFQCAIISVIHLNPGSDFKTRGHLGSQLERKAETNLKLEKDEDETITLYADKNRRAPIPRATGPRFAWNNDAGMHTRVESRQIAKDELEREELKNIFIKVFSERPAMPYTDLKVTLKNAVRVSDATAERKIARALTLKVIRKTFASLYEYVT